MNDFINMQLMQENDEDDENIKKIFAINLKNCKERGECPTCNNFLYHNIYITDKDLILFENEIFLVILEKYPRRSGHTILIIKEHHEDISEMPKSIIGNLYDISAKIINALKTVLKAKKVYFVTMCDGGRNHLHFQFIPRFEDENHGSSVFVSPRMSVKKDCTIIAQLKNIINN
ncbi:MAG: HIT family protein [Clostridia bacterium]|nr:HIT family protein [Clostridia bacterium]